MLHLALAGSDLREVINKKFIASPFSWGHTSSPCSAKKSFGWHLGSRSFWSPEVIPLSWSLWSRTGRTQGHSWVPLVKR